MPETTIVCPKCNEQLVTEDDVQGETIECPSCGTSFVVASPAVSRPPPAPTAPDSGPASSPTNSVAMPVKSDSDRMSSVVRAGWICFGIGVGLMLVLFVIPIWGPLLVAAFVLGIIAAAKKLKGGVLLLVLSVAVPPIIALFMFLVFVGGCAAAMSSEMEKQGVQFPKTPPSLHSNRR